MSNKEKIIIYIITVITCGLLSCKPSYKLESVNNNQHVEFSETFMFDKLHIEWWLWDLDQPNGSRIIENEFKLVDIDDAKCFEDSIRLDAKRKFEILNKLRTK